MLLKMSLSGGILILSITILRLLAVNKLPKKVFLLLWYIVLLRLWIPYNLPISYGIATPAENMIRKGIAVSVVKDHDSINQMAPRPPKQAAFPSCLSKTIVIQTVWLLGMILLLLYFLISYTKEYHKFQETLPVPKNTIRYLKALVPLPQRIKIVTSDKIFTPLTFGIIAPKIILPKVMNTADPDQLKYVLLHEYIHIKRNDNLLKIVMMLTVCIHWFNPLIWIMYPLFNRDMELSCDEKVISQLGETVKKEYALTLVHLAQKPIYPSFFSNGFGKNAVQERIVAIMKYKKMTVFGMGFAAILLGAAITVFAKADGAKPTGNVSEQQTLSADSNNNDIIYNLIHSERFSEYEKYGLTCDASSSHIIYEGEIVGYFKDETSEQVYTRITDRSGTVGIEVLRDDSYRITGLDKVAIPNPVKGRIKEDASTKLSVEYGEQKDNENTRESTNYKEADSFDKPLNSNTACEAGGDSSEILKEYKAFGISYHPDRNDWMYEQKHIAGFIDGDFIYFDGKEDDKAVYLKVAGALGKAALTEISESEFREWMERDNS